MENLKITKGTIVRTILVAVLVVNIILEKTGNSPIKIDEGSVASLVDTVIQIAIIAVAWWKNNSVSPNAIKADKFLKELNEEETVTK